MHALRADQGDQRPAAIGEGQRVVTERGAQEHFCRGAHQAAIWLWNARPAAAAISSRESRAVVRKISARSYFPVNRLMCPFSHASMISPTVAFPPSGFLMPESTPTRMTRRPFSVAGWE